MGVRLDIRTRRATPVQRRLDKLRPGWKAQGEFPGGRVILYTLQKVREIARRKQQQEQYTAAVDEAVATGNGAAVSSGGGGGGAPGRALPREANK